MTYKVYGLYSQLANFLGNLPVLLQALAIFACSRIWSWIVFSITARQQYVNPWGVSRPSYLEFISFWDSGWYEQIAANGYPHTLPVTSSGAVGQNAWAFYPIYPYLSGTLSKVTGLDYYLVAASISLISSFFTALVIFYLCKESLSNTAWGKLLPTHEKNQLGLWSVAVFGFLPVAAILQVPYAESFNLLFLSMTLLFLLQEQWLLALPAALVACLSRPVGVPLGAAAGIFWLYKLVHDYQSRRQRGEKGGACLWRQSFLTHALQLVSALCICGFALIWPLVAWLATGRADAYTASETAWRGTDLAPIMPWFEQATLYFGDWGILIVLGLIIAACFLLRSATIRRALSPFLTIWCASYLVYLLLFLNPQSSTFRLLLPLFPAVFPMVSISASKAFRWMLVISGAFGQLWWVSWLWHWKQLPSGGDFPP